MKNITFATVNNMKKTIFLALICLPSILSALVQTNKCEMLTQATYHKKQAASELYQAQQICFYIPDLGDKQHVYTLISSAISTAAIPDVRGKILAVGLSLLTSMATNLYDQYHEARRHFVTAAYHLEMEKFYNKISLFVNGYDKTDEGTQYFLQCVDYLTLSEMTIEGIEDIDEREIISNHICFTRNEVLKQINNSHGKLSSDVLDVVEGYMENLDEIMADFWDEGIYYDLTDLAANAFDCLKRAELAWKK